MYRVLLILFTLLIYGSSMATHNRAGEIIYWFNPDDGRYWVKIITCTKTSSPADREFLEIDWGDGSPTDSIQRSSITFLPNADAQRNEYIGSHLYLGAGIFTMSVEDPNRNGGILNIDNSVNQPFYIYSTLVINPFAGRVNNSVQLLNPPKDNACVNKPWIHNPGAYDPDGDSLRYSLVECLGQGGQPLVGNPWGYVFPDEICPSASNNFWIDAATGDVHWDVPPACQGEYNIAILIEEFDRETGAFMGSVLRDMQITLVNCSNDPPDLQALADTCVNAGDTLALTFIATDPNNHNIGLSAFGGPFEVTNSPALFTQPINSPGYSEGDFYWETNCDHVDAAAYQLYVRGEDGGGDVDLVDITTMNILVVGPAPQNPAATPNGNTIELSWEPSVCGNVTGYKIYRRTDLYGFVPSHCETGVPSYTGYTQIGTTTSLTDTTFIDNSNLSQGQQYCYMVVACFADNGGAESYASVEFCAELRRDVPIITNVSVGETNTTTGRDTIKWLMPTDLDTINTHPGPYYYEVYRGTGYGTPGTLVHTTPTNAFLANVDTLFIDNLFDTETTPYTYRIDLFSNGILAGQSQTASSIFLQTTPDDNEITLTWQEQVPWTNTEYEVYRFDGLQFNLIGTSTTQMYVDSNLINGVQYCYYVRSIGSYSSTSLPGIYYNYSQEICDAPLDLTAPCPPELTVLGDCELEENSLSWTNPNNSCTDDVIAYNVYYSPIDSVEAEDFELIASFSTALDTTMLHNNNGSIAGCYMVTAIDSVGNESEYSNQVCIDNCPQYWLPNVFTPNGDGANDLFVPLPPIKFVDSIELEIYNRWGQVIFKTTDPMINWDGIHMESGEAVPEGVYYYLCKVNSIRLSGIDVIELKGFFHLFRDGKGKVN